jgi:hypothetical protein
LGDAEKGSGRSSSNHASLPADIFLIQTASTEMSAGVMPLMRDA